MFSATLATFQMLSSYILLMATTLNSADVELFHPFRKLCWTMQLHAVSLKMGTISIYFGIARI